MYLRRVRLAPSRDHAITVENISERVSVSGRIDCVGCSTNELVEPNTRQEKYGKNHSFNICLLLFILSQKITISINFMNQIFLDSESFRNQQGSKGPYWKDQIKT